MQQQVLAVRVTRLPEQETQRLFYLIWQMLHTTTITGPASSAGRASYGASYGVTGAATPFAAPAMTSYTGSTVHDRTSSDHVQHEECQDAKALAAPSVMGATPGFNVPPGLLHPSKQCEHGRSRSQVHNPTSNPSVARSRSLPCLSMGCHG
eukprot:2416844-Amphidinium_carterae.1